MSTQIDENSEIFQWVTRALKSKNVQVKKVFLKGSTAKGEGYSGVINFVSVHGVKNGKSEVYELAIKSSHKDENLRKTFTVTLAYKNEMYVYNTLIPEFHKFETAKQLKLFQSAPKYFDGFELGQREVIVFENLKKQGYDVHDMQKPMNFNHRRLILKAYAHWHALSFALCDQNPELFEKLKNMSTANIFLENLKPTDGNSYLVPDMLEGSEKMICDILKEREEHDLLGKFQKKLEKGSVELLDELFKCAEKETYQVFTHGDCWNNNFMFKYEEKDSDRSNPTKVALVDFQLTSISSPAYDLSYHLYSSLPVEEIPNIKDQLELYYNFLAKKLVELGSDPAKVFPFSVLITQWRKYSVLGVLMSLLVLPMVQADRDNKPNIDEFNDQVAKNMIDTLKPDIKKKLFDHIICIIRHGINGELAE